MDITLTFAGNTVVLPDALRWADEYDWNPIEQTKTYTTTGALVLDQGTRQAGRPITLQGDEASTWMLRSACDQVMAWKEIAGVELSLVLRGVERTVVFDHERGGFEARPLIEFSDVDATDWYVPTFRFLEI